MRVKGAKHKPDAHTSTQRFVKFQRLQWLIIDECSTAALEVLAALEKHLQDAVRPKNSWKCHKSGVARPFAGLNVLVAGDCWRFPAVKATSLFQNPFKSGQSLAVAALQKILWTHNQNNVQHLFELTKEHRCTDPWLSAVLKAARRRAVDQELWSFLHGYPTLHPGSWHPATDTCGCKNPTCEGLPKIWTQEVLHGNDARTWAARLGDECNVCSAERRRRCIVAAASDFGPNPEDPKFLHAPFIRGLNAAKYAAALLRAWWVAAEQNQLCGRAGHALVPHRSRHRRARTSASERKLAAESEARSIDRRHNGTLALVAEHAGADHPNIAGTQAFWPFQKYTRAALQLDTAPRGRGSNPELHRLRLGSAPPARVRLRGHPRRHVAAPPGPTSRRRLYPPGRPTLAARSSRTSHEQGLAARAGLPSLLRRGEMAYGKDTARWGCVGPWPD